MTNPDAPAPTAEELRELPVFPLPSVVLLPGGVLPLHLFEPRYREMIFETIEGGGTLMAVAMFEPGWEPDYEGRPAIRPIAGLGRIRAHRQHANGRWDILLDGLVRVELSELPPNRSYRLARAEVIADRISHPKVVEEARSGVFSLASSIAALIRAEHTDFELGVEATMSASQLCDRLADRLVPDPETRQRILETSDVKVRLALVQDAMVELMARLPRNGPARGAPD